MTPAWEQQGSKAGAGLFQVTALGGEQPQGVGDRVGCSSVWVGECEPDEKGAATAASGATTNQAVTQSGSCSLLGQLGYCSTPAAKPQVMFEERANITVGEKLWKTN